MNYKQLDISERLLLEKCIFKQNLSIRKTAEIMERSPSTISREIKRNSIDGTYKFREANKKMEMHSQHKYSFQYLRYQEFNKLFLFYFDKKTSGVKSTWTYIKMNFNIYMPTWRQVYNWFKSGFWYLNTKDRLRLYYKKGRKRKIGIFGKTNKKTVIPIRLRPEVINNRKTFGHWEIDLVIGKKAKGHDALLTFTERLTRMNFVRRVKSKNPFKLNGILYNMIKENNIPVYSISADNGIEFEKLGLVGHWLKCKIYQCEPYASCQRGTNENCNGIIRRFYKKGTDFSLVTDAEIDSMSDQINNMRREMFLWDSSIQRYKQNIEEIKINK